MATTTKDAAERAAERIQAVFLGKHWRNPPCVDKRGNIVPDEAEARARIAYNPELVAIIREEYRPLVEAIESGLWLVEKWQDSKAVEWVARIRSALAAEGGAK